MTSTLATATPIPVQLELFKRQLVLPAYNEEENLPQLFESLADLVSSGFLHSIVIVDDGSRDRTAELAEQYADTLPIQLIRHGRNRGLAAAIRTGLAYAAKHGEPNGIVFTMDSDNTQPIGLMPRMSQLVSEGNDVVIASRYRSGARVVGLSPFRHLTSIGAGLMFKTILPIPGVRDYTCGYRAYRCETLRDALDFYGSDFVSETGFTCMVDILLKLHGRGAIFGEAPMILRYDQKRGASKMPVFKTIMQTFRLAFRRRLGLR